MKHRDLIRLFVPDQSSSGDNMRPDSHIDPKGIERFSELKIGEGLEQISLEGREIGAVVRTEIDEGNLITVGQSETLDDLITVPLVLEIDEGGAMRIVTT